MLKNGILHPELLLALAEAGHGSRILVADANYPVTVKAPPDARRVYLNFLPGLIGGTAIVAALATMLPMESAHYMTPDGNMPEIVREYQAAMAHVQFTGLDRMGFYREAQSSDTTLVIASGETRTYANLLLTVGVRHA